ncbi:MAG TPA: hypothetical protein VIX84_17520 [Acidimicrobiales bacterium]
MGAPGIYELAPGLYKVVVSLGRDGFARETISQRCASCWKCQQADRLLAESSIVPRFGRLEEVAGDLGEALRRHTPPDVVDRDHGSLALAPEHDPDPGTALAALRVLVRRVRDELVQGVLGVSVHLAGDQNGLPAIADPKPNLLRRHERQS